MVVTKRHRTLVVVGLLVDLVACGGSSSGDETDDDPNTNPECAAEVPDFGEESSAVILASPRINEGSQTSVTVGGERSVIVEVGNRGPFSTDDTGLATLAGLGTGAREVDFGSDIVDFEIQQKGEHYDVVVAAREDGAEYIVQPIRYPVGGTVKRLEDGDSLEQAVSEEDSVVFLGPGSYQGDFQIRSESVLIFGAWSPEDGPLATIEGDLEVRGGGNRLRSVHVTGEIASPANGFAAAFCRFSSADISGNNVTLIRNVFTDGQASVPSSNAVLVDNEGIP